MHTGPVTECTHISEEFLAEERAQGESHFQQEYMCEFVETGRYPFDESLVRGMVKQEEKPWDWI